MLVIIIHIHFAGNLDIVFCFYCGQGLQDWKDDDVPWCEHARWSSDCPFLLNIKGQEFVRLEQLKHIDPLQVRDRERERREKEKKERDGTKIRMYSVFLFSLCILLF